MLSPFRWPEHGWRLLIDRLERLRETLDAIQNNVRQAIARAIGETFGDLLHEIVHILLADGQPAPPPSAYRRAPLRREPGWDRSSRNDDYWHERQPSEEEEERRWLAEQPDWREEDEEPTPPPSENRPRWLQAI